MITIGLIVVALTVLAEGSSPLGVATTEHFNNSLTLDSKGNYVLFWNFNSTHVTFEVHVKTRGYIGFGLSPNGNMYPADVVIGWVKNGTVFFKDRHTTAKSTPIVDNSQDWILLHGEENDFGTLLKFVRKIDTCDTEDIKINDATQRIIYSYHPDDPSDENSLMYHGAERRGTKSVSLLMSSRPPVTYDNDETKLVDITAGNYIIPSKDTTYLCVGFQMPDLGGKHHMIMYLHGCLHCCLCMLNSSKIRPVCYDASPLPKYLGKFEPIFTPGNEQFLHHLTIQRCFGRHPELHMKRGECLEKYKPDEFPACPEMFLAWAVGGGPFYFPENTGYSVGATDDLSFYMIQVHYDNPSLKSGVIDNSGIRMHLTSKLRQHDVGTLILGTNPNPLIIIPHQEPAFLHSGYCSESCMKEGFDRSSVKEIKFVAAFQHAHLLGKAIKTRHFRNGTELKPIQDDPNYDFYFQEFRPLVPEVVVKPGDSFIVECTYDTMKRANVSYGGFTTREEMCETMVYHYPKLPLTVCQSYPLMEAWYNKGRIITPDAIAKYRHYVETTYDWTDPAVRANVTNQVHSGLYNHICAGPNSLTQGYWGNYSIFAEHGRTFTPYQPPKSVCV